MFCPYCAAEAECKDSKVIYGRSYGNVWICSNYPVCDAYVGCHGGSKVPLGRMADPELREWKKRAHAKFDPLWKSGRMKRHGAYMWLADKLGIEKKDCHIGMFDIDMCKRVIDVVSGPSGKTK